jgi:hypothetical protein
MRQQVKANTNRNHPGDGNTGCGYRFPTKLFDEKVYSRTERDDNQDYSYDMQDAHLRPLKSVMANTTKNSAPNMTRQLRFPLMLFRTLTKGVKSVILFSLINPTTG